jgi:hypothetical protein
MKNSNSQSIISSSSSDVVELPPLLPPQGELIRKMQHFLRIPSPQEKEKQNQLNELRNLRRMDGNLSQEDKDFVIKLINQSETMVLMCGLWHFVDKYLVDKAIEVDADDSQQLEKKQIKQLLDLERQIKNMADLNQDQQDSLKDLLEIKKEEELHHYIVLAGLVNKKIATKAVKIHENNLEKPEKFWQLFYLKHSHYDHLTQDQQDSLKALLEIKKEEELHHYMVLSGLVDKMITIEAIKIHENNPEKSTEIDKLLSLRTQKNNGSLLTADKQNLAKDLLRIKDDKLPDNLWDLVDQYVNSSIEEQNRESAFRAEITDKVINPDGVCQGLAVLWSFGKNLEDQGLNGDEFDNIAFMRKTANILVNWNGYAELEDQDTKDIERFISNIRTYQSPIGKLLDENAQSPTGEILGENTQDPLTEDLRKVVLESQGLRLFETTKKLADGTYQRVKKYFHETVTTDINGLESRLEDIMKQSGKMVAIAIRGKSSAHALSAYKAKAGTMYFYDPNEGEKKVDSIEHLAKEIQGASESLFPESKIGLTNFEVRIYDYTDDEDSGSLDQQKFLITTEDELKKFMKSADLLATEDRYMLYKYLSKNAGILTRFIEQKDADTLYFMNKSGLSDIIDLERCTSPQYIDYILSDLYHKHDGILKLLKAGVSNKDISYLLHQYKILCFSYNSESYESYESFKAFKEFVFENIDSVVSFVQNGNSLKEIKAEYDKFPDEQSKDYPKIIEQIAEAFEKISTEETTKQALFRFYEMALEKLSTTEGVDENNNMLDQTQLEHIDAEHEQKIGVTSDMFCCAQ